MSELWSLAPISDATEIDHDQAALATLAACPDRFGASSGDGAIEPSHRVGHPFVWTNQREKVRESRWWLADVRTLRAHSRQRTREDDERLAVRQRRRRCENAVEPGRSRVSGDLLGDGVVVADQIGFGDAEKRPHPLVGEVEDLEVDGHAPDAASQLERIDPLADEVPEQLGPRRLLLTRCVPDAVIASPVVAAVATRRISTRRDARVESGPDARTPPSAVDEGPQTVATDARYT